MLLNLPLTQSSVLEDIFADLPLAHGLGCQFPFDFLWELRNPLGTFVFVSSHPATLTITDFG